MSADMGGKVKSVRASGYGQKYHGSPGKIDFKKEQIERICKVIKRNVKWKGCTEILSGMTKCNSSASNVGFALSIAL